MMDCKKLRGLMALVMLSAFACASAGWTEEPDTEESLITVLQSAATPAEKAAACAQLKLVGTERAVPALAALLNDEELSHCARYALESMPCRKARLALKDALAETGGLTRIGIITSLGVRGEREAVPSLVPLLRDEDEAAACAAARALGKLGGPKAIRALLELMPSSKDALHKALTEAVLNCADDLLATGRMRQAARIYASIYHDGTTGVGRAAALSGLSRAEGANSVDTIVKAFADEDESVQRMAARLVRTVGGEAATGTFSEALDDLPHDSQVLLLHALAARGDAAARPKVEEACNYDNVEIRRAAIRALAVLGNADSVELLLDHALDAPGESERAQALESLTKLNGEDVDAGLIALLADTVPSRGVVAASVLEERQASTAASALLELAQSAADGELRRTAIHALGACARGEDVPALAGLLETVNAEEVPEVQRVLLLLWRRTPKDGRDRSALIAGLKSTRGSWVRARFAETLGYLGDGSGLSPLREALGDESPEVRAAAIRALSSWPNPDPLQDLLRVARSDDNEAHRLLALRGYLGMAGSAEGVAPEERFQNLVAGLELASREEEKKQAIGLMGNIPTLPAFEKVESYLYDPALHEDAAMGMCKIGTAIAGYFPLRVRTAIENLLLTETSEQVREFAWNILGEPATNKSDPAGP